MPMYFVLHSTMEGHPAMDILPSPKGMLLPSPQGCIAVTLALEKLDKIGSLESLHKAILGWSEIIMKDSFSHAVFGFEYGFTSANS